MTNYTYKTEFGSTLGVVASSKEEAHKVFAEFFPNFSINYEDILVAEEGKND